MSNTIKQDLWNQLFPSLPICALPETVKENISPDELISFVKDNIHSIVDTWTYAVRFKWVNWRFAMHEDDEWDVAYREMMVRKAIRRVF